jgi:hypothetical protein
MGGGKGMLTPTSTLPIAIVGLGTAITNAKSAIPKSNFFIYCLLYIKNVLSLIILSRFQQPAARYRP